MYKIFKYVTYQRALYWLLLFFLALSIPRLVNYLQYFSSEWFTFRHFLKYEVVLLLFATILSLPILFKGRLVRIYMLMSGCSILGYAALELWHVIEFHGFPNSATFFSIFSTNINESWALIDNLFGVNDLFLILGFWLLFVLLHKILKRIQLPYPKVIYFFLLVISVSSFSALSYLGRLAPASMKNASFLGGINAYTSFLQEHDRFSELVSSTIIQPGFNRQNEHQNETHVIVIGESTSRHHMSLFGYERNTNPKLSLNKDIIAFKNVSSSHAHTYPALEKAFSFKSDDSLHLGIENGTILDLLRQANYKTIWLSNQAITGRFETPVSVLASKADKKIFSNVLSGHEAYDEILLEDYTREINTSGNKVIFVHLMGTHMSYSDRYPVDFDHFTGAREGRILQEDQLKFINTYDNAVRYNDHIIAELIERLENMGGVCSLLYFSDHGDEVYDYRDFHGHSDVLRSKYMVDVPLLIWTNEQYRNNNAAQIEIAELNTRSTYKTDELIHTMADLYDVHCNLTDPEKSLLFEQIPSYRHSLVSTPCKTANDINFTSNILCHRVNGIKRLHEVKDDFGGFEIDLTYQSSNNKFDVNHPPVESIDLSLKQMLATLDDPRKYYYWLDMKNLDSVNVIYAAKRLHSVANKLGITKRIVVESPRIECLREFQDHGFYTALYLPFLQEVSEIEMQSKIDSLVPLINRVKPSAISQRYDAYNILETQFPDCDKLTWDIKLDWKVEKDEKYVTSIVKKSPGIKLFLVRYETDNYR